jgi:hypothetical protein
MRQQISKDLFAYWSRLKGARAAPDRADIDPAAIRHILADTFIIEVDTAEMFPLRLAGSRVNALSMRDSKGASFVEMWRESDRRAITSALLTVVDGVTPVIAGVRTTPAGDVTLELELLLLPLRHFGKTHSRVLGALAPVYQPPWLGQLRAGPLELISMRVIDAVAPASGSNYRRFDERSQRGNYPRLVVCNSDKPS